MTDSKILYVHGIVVELSQVHIDTILKDYMLKETMKS